MRTFLSLALLALTLPTVSAVTTRFSHLHAATTTNTPSTPIIIENFPSYTSNFTSTAPRTNKFLYVSFHGGKNGQGVNEAQRYNFDGTLAGPVYSNTCSSQGLRSMVLLPDSTLLIANADDSNSRVLHFGQCDSTGTRTYLADYVSNSLQHPYGLALGSDTTGNRLYVSSQNINTVNSYSTDDQSFIGVLDNLNPDQIRGLAFDSTLSLLFIADKDANTVYAWNTRLAIIDPASNIPANDPIGLYFVSETRRLYIGSNGDNSVIQWNVDTHTVEKTFSDATNLQHPAGIVVNGDDLYVISQTQGTILKFSVSSGQFVGVIASSLPDVPEQLLLSDC